MLSPFASASLQLATFLHAVFNYDPCFAATSDDIIIRNVKYPDTPTKASIDTGTVITTLESGDPTLQPFPTTPIPSVISTISPKPFNPIELFVEKSASPPTISTLFGDPIATTPPASGIPSRSDHPVPKEGVVNQTSPSETNKFYANFFLGDQTNPVWTHPYSLTWVKGTGNAKSWGLGVSHIEPSQRAYGPNPVANPVEYYVNPLGIESLILSATNLDSSMSLTTDKLTAFSVNANLIAGGTTNPAVTIPLVQGMGFVTAIYHDVTPHIHSNVLFQKAVALDSPKTGVAKYKIVLDDDTTWLLYATSANGAGFALNFTSNTRLVATAPFAGTIQVAKNPGDVATQEALYDSCAGAYAMTASLSGSVNGASGSYSLSWAKSGNGASLMMFALPHHIESMGGVMIAGKTAIQLQTTTKGLATAVIGDSWTFEENDLPVTIGFAPWSPDTGSATAIPFNAQTAISAASLGELSQDMAAQSNLTSMYYSGKALSKFATAIYAVHDLAGNASLANAGLTKLKDAYARFTSNNQVYPLVYESQWGGIVSTATYVTGDSGDDFGNTYYNDHHFHWSYFIYAASIIGYLDPTWLPANRDYVNTLIRDAANPSPTDPYFPFSRSFDWYHGHSWAKGLFPSSDGKDQESTSEDAFFSYALKLWGRVTNDTAMEARGNLMLAIQKRSFRNYFLLESDNGNQPENFVANKVTGILFENKVDHTTYFGNRTEFVQGIHMIPINPSSAYTRDQGFVREEWERYFSGGRVDNVEGGWRGILYGNLAIIDPKASYNWVSGPDFNPIYLDDGATRTWYLAYAAGLGGAS